MAFLSEKAREQVERILEYVALGGDGAAVLASIDGALIASSRRTHHTRAAKALAALATGTRPPHVQVHALPGQAVALVVASSPRLACGVLQQRTLRALGLLSRMVATGREPLSGAPAVVSTLG